MSAKGARTESAGQPTSAKSEPKRINVAVSPDTVRALENVIEREGVTLTEALRRSSISTVVRKFQRSKPLVAGSKCTAG